VKDMHEIDWSRFKDKKKLFVAADAGGANVLASLIKTRNLQGDYLLSNPATRIFKDAGLIGTRIQAEQNTFREYEIMLSSTGKDSGFEIQAMSHAMRAGVRVIAILDHWVNYRNRFTLDGLVYRPNAMIATDSESIRRAKIAFGEIELFTETNFYLKSEVNQAKSSKTIEIDFLLLDEKSGMMQKEKSPNFIFYSELVAKLMAIDSSLRIAVRPHPARKPFELDKFEESGISVSRGNSLGFDIGRSLNLIGLSSMSFYIAFLAGKSIFSLEPNVSMISLPLTSVKALDLKRLEDLVSTVALQRSLNA